MMIFIFRSSFQYLIKILIYGWFGQSLSIQFVTQKKALKNVKKKFKSHKNETVLQHLKGLTSLIVKQVFWSISCE